MFNWTIIITIIAYVLVMGGFIIYLTVKHKQDTQEEYAVAGRDLGWVQSALSSITSLSSGFLFIGFMGLGYSLGGFASWYLLSDCFNVLLLWSFFAWRIKRMGDFHRSIDVPDILADMYNDKKNILRAIASVAVIVFMTGYVSSQITAASKTMAPVFNLSLEGGIILSAIVVFIYTFFAGFRGVAMTDTAQGFIIMAVTFTMPFMAVHYAGGWQGMTASLANIDPILLTGRGSAPLAVAIATVVGWMFVALSTFGHAHVSPRIFAIKDVNLMKRSALLAAIFMTLTRLAALVTGMAARSIFPNLADPEMAFSILVQQAFPPVLSGIMICAVIACIMTTADSQLLAASTTITRNVYQKIFKGQASESQLVLINKAVMVCLIIFCTIGSIQLQGLVFWMVIFASVGGGAALGIPLVMGLVWKRANVYGAAAGSAIGLLTVIIWKMSGLSSILHEGIPGLTFAFLAVVIVSLLTKEDPFRIKQHQILYDVNYTPNVAKGKTYTG